jgi:hypothetical protein
MEAACCMLLFELLLVLLLFDAFREGAIGGLPAPNKWSFDPLRSIRN